MKHLIILLFVAISISSFAQDDEGDDTFKSDFKLLAKESLSLSKNDPQIEIAFTPKEGDAIAYLPLPTGGQLSIGMIVYNIDKTNLKIDKVVITCGTQVKEVATKPNDIANIKPNHYNYWQNKRGYNEEGDVMYFNGTVPNSVTIDLYVDGYKKPVSITKDLKPYSTKFLFPFKAEDLEPGEYVLAGSTHGGGGQVYAYDMTVVGGRGKMSPKKRPDLDTSENMRVFGKPVYAICDGEIIEYRDNNPDNLKPGDRDSPEGNTVLLKHGDLIIRFHHLKQGSLNKQFKVGSKVKAGDLLGHAGNSGHNTSGPHLHIGILRADGGITPFVFSNGFASNREDYTPGSTPQWTPLNGNGIPGFATKKSLVWPAQNPPSR